MLPSIRTCLPAELEAVLAEMGEKKYRMAQIMRWVFAERVESWDGMTNISKVLRGKLAERFALEPLPVPEEHVAKDGTNKSAFKLSDNSVVEAVLILCVLCVAEPRMGAMRTTLVSLGSAVIGIGGGLLLPVTHDKQVVQFIG